MKPQKLILKNLDTIREEIFKISLNRKLFEDLFGKNYYDAKYGSFAYAVYTDKDELIRGYQIRKENEVGGNFKKELADFIKLYNPKTFTDFCFFLSAAPFNSKETRIRDAFRKRYRRCEIVDLVLENSHGFLLWPYQFKHLLVFFWDKGWADLKVSVAAHLTNHLGSGDVYSKLLLAMGRKDRFCWNSMKKLKFTSSYNMHDVLTERLIRGHLCNPNVEGAYRLYQVVTRDGTFV